MPNITKSAQQKRAQQTTASFRPLYEVLGVAFASESNGQALAEACPFCGGEKFYVNVTSGLFKCHKGACGKSGNAVQFLDHIHKQRLDSTADADYRRLKETRGLPLQTFKRFGVAWYGREFLLPQYSPKGTVVGGVRDNLNGRRMNLPGIASQLYGLNELSNDASKWLFVLEGPYDLMAADHQLRAIKKRDRYDVIAVPSATTFQGPWAKFLANRKVGLLFDNDDAGKKGQERAAKIVRDANVGAELYLLEWPNRTRPKYDIANLVHDQPDISLPEFTQAHCVRAAATQSLTFLRGDAVTSEHVSWLAKGRVQAGTFASLSGTMGTHKSGIARYMAACGTAGLSMFGCPAVAPYDVLYFTSEDAASRVSDLVRVHDGDLSRLQIHDIVSSSEPADLLDYLDEIAAAIRSFNARLVVLDALNSFVGGDITTDSKARRTLSGKLQALARRSGACILGIRNWGRQDAGSASQKALGATSLSDVARCVLNTQELPPRKEQPDERRFLLEWEKQSDAPRPGPLFYSVESLADDKDEATSHLRKLWFQIPPPKKVPKKGTTPRQMH